MEDFFTMLKEFDSIKTSDCLIRNNIGIDVRYYPKKGKLRHWVVTEDLSDFSSPKKTKNRKNNEVILSLFFWRGKRSWD